MKATRSGWSESDRSAEEKTTRTVTICTATGRLATPYCPETIERVLKPGEATPGRCRVHGGHEGGPAPGTGGDVPGNEGSGEARGGGATVVTVCAKTGLRASASCPQTIEKSFPAGKGPSGVCHSCGRGHGEPEAKPEPPAKPAPPAKPEPPTKPGSPGKAEGGGP